MSDQIKQLSSDARRAIAARDWSAVNGAALSILSIQKNNAEGLYLLGLSQTAGSQGQQAIQSFSDCLGVDSERYDAAVELATLHWLSANHQSATDLLDSYQSKLANSPKYLFLAAETYSKLGLHGKAWPLYQLADRLQPGTDSLQAAMAACATRVGEIEAAKAIYTNLLLKNPDHQRNHYELSRLITAADDTHVKQMKSVLERTVLSRQKIFSSTTRWASSLRILGNGRRHSNTTVRAVMPLPASALPPAIRSARTWN